MQRVEQTVSAVSKACSLASAIAVAVIMLVLLADAGSRFFTGGSLAGAYELTEMVLVFSVYLGLAHAERTTTHVRTDLVTNRLSQGFAAYVRTFGNAVAVVTVMWLVWATYGNAANSVSIMEYRQGLISFPIWPGKVIVTIGLALLFAELVLKTFGASPTPDGATEAESSASQEGVGGIADDDGMS